MTDRIDYRVPEGVLADDIDGFHVPPDDDWLQLETNWVWFFVPERKLGCWAYHFIRPSIGLDAGSIQVWDDTAWHHTEIPYYRQVLYGQLPAERDLHDFTFSTGFRWTMLEPRQRYRLRYDDAGVCSFDLEWAAIMDPWLPPKGDPPRVTHLDQWGHVTGELVLHGESMTVDCYAMRDRSWQITRAEGGTTPFWGGEINNGWMAAAADANTAFFGTKWIVLDGHLSQVVESEVRRERDREHGFLRRIVITARDEDGRDFEAIGDSVSRLVAPIPNSHAVSVNSLMDYRINGIQAWGDDQDSWGLGTWAAMRRKQQGLVDVRTTPPNTGSGGLMKFDKGRDFEHARETLEQWLCHRLDLASASVTDLVLPDRAGLSNETILFTAELTAETDGGTTTTTEELVVRISPAPENQLCRDTLFEEQARLLQVLHGQGVRVPDVRWFEDDPKWFDRPFFVMDRAHGRVPISDPIYNAEGWLHDATPEQQRTAWEGAVDELVRINQTPPDLVRFLPGGASGFAEVLDEIRAEYAWACDGVAHPIVDRLWEWLEANVPPAPPTGLSWGDARLGNTMFDDDFQLVVVMDWELTSLGTPVMDLGWWLFFDVVHSETVPRLPGLGSRQETIDRWEQGTGLSADGVEWYEILAAVRLTTLVIRAMNLQGFPSADWIPFTRLAYDRLGWSDPTVC